MEGRYSWIKMTFSWIVRPQLLMALCQIHKLRKLKMQIEQNNELLEKKSLTNAEHAYSRRNVGKEYIYQVRSLKDSYKSGKSTALRKISIPSAYRFSEMHFLINVATGISCSSQYFLITSYSEFWTLKGIWWIFFALYLLTASFDIVHLQ